MPRKNKARKPSVTQSGILAAIREAREFYAKQETASAAFLRKLDALEVKVSAGMESPHQWDLDTLAAVFEIALDWDVMQE